MVDYSLPSIAPAAWPGWCSDVLNFIHLLHDPGKVGCEFITVIQQNYGELLRIANLIASPTRPKESSQTEQFCVGFWNAFLTDASGIIRAIQCKSATNKSQVDLWKIFGTSGYCQGPPDVQTIWCYQFVGDISLGGALTQAVGVVQDEQAIIDLEGLEANIKVICEPSGEFSDFLQCCEAENQAIQDRLNLIKQRI